MSMLSVQCDELRKAARGQKAMGLFDLAQMLNDAADTIWELRDSVHRERAEADKLREQGARLFDKTLELGTENAKLRELVRDMCEWAYIDSCCSLQGEFADRMRELGIEVDG